MTTLIPEHTTPANEQKRRIQIIINPAAGQDQPILGTLNRAFKDANVDWDVSITKEAGDARRFAQAAAEAGVDIVGVYGGDGTVMEVASGLMGTNVPLAIFPGGTANVMSVELGISSDLAEAVAIVCNDDVCYTRWVDMGQVDDERYFMLRVGIGFEAQMVEGAPREMKDRWGVMAYALSALQALREPQIAHYRITLDGETVDTEGMTCIIANAGSLGQAGLTLAPNIDVSDGLLDVVVIRSADLPSLLAVAASVVRGDENAEPLLHWQGREIVVEAEPAQSVQADGEVLNPTPVRAKVIPHAVQVVVPKPPDEATAA